MLKKIHFLLALCPALLLAEFQICPSENILWRETGQDIRTSPSTDGKAWFDKYLQIRSAADGIGFELECTEKNPSKGHSTHRIIPCDPQYPWLTFRIRNIQLHPGYQSWCVILSNPRFKIGQVNHPQEGTFSFNCFDGVDQPQAAKQCNLFFYVYTLRLLISDLSMVKKPDNYLEATSEAFAQKKSFSVNDTLKFTAYLHEPAEDVSLRLLYTDGLYEIPLNGSSKLQLKPENQEQKVWSAQVRIESLGKTRNKTSFAKGEIMLRATILGSVFQEPLFGSVNYPYLEPENEK